MERLKRLQELRERNGLTQKDVAEILGTTAQYYQKYETGIRPLPIAVLIKLAGLYNTSIDYLLGVTDQKIPHTRKKV